MRKITEDEVQEVMDSVTFVYDQIKEARITLNIIEEEVGNICNLIKCLDKENEK